MTRALLLFPILLAGCAAAPPATSIESAPGDSTYVATADPEHPRLRFADGQLSRNDSCFVRIGNKLNFKIPPIYINGSPVGFC